ncbi:hypothetical protein [Paenibacillus thalictri]|uniref:Uncharacterized protein n=1 Tax=Paenibacillus thalictri TaxID=2527873 RepID=A0A4Q9DU31_9BACL|nr:hypothetical protein [Paenibacillus thalictri]TBL80466.1 hypothetical protein EYB31_08630 [Paenibacillus thalictri]
MTACQAGFGDIAKPAAACELRGAVYGAISRKKSSSRDVTGESGRSYGNDVVLGRLAVVLQL